MRARKLTMKGCYAIQALKEAVAACKAANLELHGFEDGIYVARKENVKAADKYPHLPGDAFALLEHEKLVFKVCSSAWTGVTKI